MKQFVRDNPALKEKVSLKRVLQSLNESEKKAFRSMSEQEIEYLSTECYIQEYVDYLRNGQENKAVGSDFPILVIQGTQLQLERYKVVFLLTLTNYQGVQEYYPDDFSLEYSTVNDIKEYTGVALVRVKRGSATSYGLDIHRSELILGSLLKRRDLFNPTLILAEEVIEGKLNISDGITVRVVELDPNKLGTCYEGEPKVVFSKATKSRKKEPSTPVYINTTPAKNSNNNSNNYIQSGNNNNKKGGRRSLSVITDNHKLEQED